MIDTISAFLGNLAETFTTLIQSIIVDVAGSVFGVEDLTNQVDPNL